MTKLKLALCLATLASTYAGHARAVDGKVYPGVMCVGDTWSRYVGRSQSGGSVWVDYETPLYCPLTGDAESGSGITTMRVLVVESSNPPAAGGRENTRCVVSRYGTLGGMPFDQSAATAANSPATQTLTLSLTKAGGPAFARYGLYCQTTAGSAIVEYEVDET